MLDKLMEIEIDRRVGIAFREYLEGFAEGLRAMEGTVVLLTSGGTSVPLEENCVRAI
jgi:hypothetical protein